MARVGNTFGVGTGLDRTERDVGHRLFVHWSRGSLRHRRSAAPATGASASSPGAAPTEELSLGGAPPSTPATAVGRACWPRFCAFMSSVWERTLVTLEVLGRVLLLLLPGFSSRGLRRILRAVRMAVRAAAADLGFDIARGRRSSSRRRRLDPRLSPTEIRLLSGDLVSGNLLRAAISQADVAAGQQGVLTNLMGLPGLQRPQETSRSGFGSLANLAALANLSPDSAASFGTRMMVVSIDLRIDDQEEEQISGLGAEQVAWWLAADHRLADYDRVAAMDPPWCCPICTEGLEGENSHGWVVTICGEGCEYGHLYHEACLREWLLKSNTCPVCRRNPVVCPDNEPAS